MPGTNFHLRNPAVGSNDRALRVRGDEISACGAPEEILNDEAVRRMNDSDPVPGYFNHRRGDPETDAPAFPQVPRILLAAPGSGSGKTLVTCGILRLLQRNGFKPAAFKCGPDYIDPMFHRQVLGIPSGNLDTFFSPGGGAREILQRTVRKYGADIAVIEGVMGLFDGTGVSGMEASSWDLAAQTQTPVILVVDAKGMGRSVVPFIKGFRDYETTAVKILGKLRAEKLMNKGAEAEKPAGVGVSEETPAEKCCDGEFRGRIHGVILNRISPGMAPVMKKWIEEETGLRVAGYLPQDVSLSWGSRHLGLMQPEEVKDFRGQIDHLADILEKTLDTRILLEIAAEGSGMYDFSEKNSRQEARGAGKFTEETHRQEARRME
ncbi:MAG: hypothetical protein Q4D81_13250, partial [Eubacteriales bacterium]|nr:hypothetical protein [Eubacteriales bacterium]